MRWLYQWRVTTDVEAAKRVKVSAAGATMSVRWQSTTNRRITRRNPAESPEIRAKWRHSRPAATDPRQSGSWPRRHVTELFNDSSPLSSISTGDIGTDAVLFTSTNFLTIQKSNHVALATVKDHTLVTTTTQCPSLKICNLNAIVTALYYRSYFDFQEDADAVSSRAGLKMR